MTTTPNTKKARVVRTPAQVAVDRLDAARARLARAKAASAKAAKASGDAMAANDAAVAEVKAAQAVVEFESRHPDLPVNRPDPGATS